jgi:glycosyltransferase involved in cell wall biosynthesis
VISVIVPVRNGMPWLEDQLRALVDQECAEAWEVIIADNGSTDDSPAVAHQWADRHDTIRWIDASALVGPGAARNAGAKAAHGKLLAFCDADDVVQPGWLAGCAQALAHADVVAGVFDFRSLNGLPASSPIPASTQQLGFLPAGLGANLAIRRDAFEAMGGFSSELLIGEDVDLCWRLQLNGFRFDVEFGAVVAKREPQELKAAFRHAVAYGRSGPALYRRYRDQGARPGLSGAAKSWAWLVLRSPRLVKPGGQQIEWARAAGVRLGRLLGSIRERVFFP